MWQPYIIEGSYRGGGDLVLADHVMKNTFQIGVHPALTHEMLDFVVRKIENYLGVEF